MSIELWSIAALALMMLLVTFLQGGLVPATQGLKWGLGSRDEPLEKSAIQGRFARTVQNHAEAMLMFVPLMALVVYLGRENEWTAVAAWLVIIGRAIFIPCYILGVFGLRSVGYGIALTGVFITAWQLLHGG